MILSSVFCVTLFTFSLFEMHDCVQYYGCQFADDFFKYNLTKPFGINVVQAYVLDDTEQLTTILRVATTKNSEVMSTYPINTIQEFLWFHTYYRAERNSNRDKSFLEIIEEYRPTFRTLESVHSMLAQVLLNILSDRTIREHFPNLMQSMYFASADNHAPPQIGNRIRQNFFKKNTFHHTHVVAVIKFKLREVVGHIIIDTGMGLHPFSLMVGQRGVAAVHYHIRDFAMVFKSVGDSGQFMLGEMNYVRILYYLEHPFCDMLDSTTKNQLLREKQFILFRDGDGKFVAEIAVKVPETFFQITFPNYIDNLPGCAEVPFNQLNAIMNDQYEDSRVQSTYTQLAQQFPQLHSLLNDTISVMGEEGFMPEYKEFLDEYGLH